MKRKKKEKHNMGITLIALVITIIVLLILAGVSIATLTGENGILTQAQNAKNETEEAEAQEKEELENQNSLIEDIVNGITQGQDTNMELMLTITTATDNEILLNINVTNITQEIVDEYKFEVTNLSFEEKETVTLDLVRKAYSTIFSSILNKKITTDKELLEAMKEVGMITDSLEKFDTLKDYLMYTLEKSNEEEGTNKTYEEYIDMVLENFIGESSMFTGAGILDVVIENEEGEKLNYTSIRYEKNKYALSSVPIFEFGKYRVTVEVANTGIILTNEIYIGKYMVKENDGKFYLQEITTNEKSKIKEAYIYVNKEKKNASEYIKEERRI